MAEVAVDPETGQVTVRHFTTAHDVGTVINPIGHQGQIEGGLIQGLGFALMEEMQTEDGRISTLSLGDVKLPTIQDIPPLTTVLLEDPVGPGPFNAKAIGEGSISAVAPAIANAVADACGVRILDLPITAEKVYFALKERRVAHDRDPPHRQRHARARWRCPAYRTLLDCLRYDLGLTGSKEGCGVGVCGACTVLLDGRMISSCIALAVFADGREVTTVEGLAGDERLHPVQQAFMDAGGFQCGICTPGQVVAAKALLDTIANPSDAEIREWMLGNLCRCTGYYKIVESIRAAAERSRA